MLSIILPTFNESQNLPELLKRIAHAMGRAEYEVIVVDDDSPDQTWRVAEDLQSLYPTLNVIHRVGRRGLSSAVVEGFDRAKGTVFCVMDSDLQHDPALLVQMADAVKNGSDIVVASRYMKGGSVGEWVRGRRFLSRTATWLTRKIPAVEVSDPMSGFFALKRSVYAQIRPMLRPSGFKILFEILGHLPATSTVSEVPLVFRMRTHGESKLSVFIELQFVWQLLRITLYRVQHILFWIVCVSIGIALLLRLYPMLPLYTSAAVRSQVQLSLRTAADAEGWLLSDLRILRVDLEQMIVMHRPHRKGIDPDAHCYRIEYATSIPQEIKCGR